VLKAVSKGVDARLGGFDNSALLLDETCSAKKGNKSVGVQRQWLGRYGKVDNGQVFVCAALSRGDKVGLLGNRLFLSKKWVENEARCKAAGIPDEHIVHRTKQELALELVKEARANGVRFSWVGADGLYGNDPAFLRNLDQIGETFVIDCHNNQTIWLEDPRPYIPTRQHIKGRTPSKLTTDIDSTTVSQWVHAQKQSAWRCRTIRKAYKGKLRAEFLCKRVRLWDGSEKTPQKWWLIVRREIGNKAEIKYTLSNAPEETPPHKLARMQAQRFWIERSFQDAKSHAGFDQYQVRGWKGLHHHIAMVFLVMLFILEERLALRIKLQKISCADIINMLRSLLPRRLNDPDDMARHIERKNDILC